MKKKIAILFQVMLTTWIFAQPYPDEKVGAEFLATYGNMSKYESYFNSYSQTIFFALPVNYDKDFYFRIFDPDCGGRLDKLNGLWETNTIFEVYGGEGCLSDKDSRLGNQKGNYKAGKLLERKLFARESAVDGSWVTFGPFSISEGEQIDAYGDYRFFKIIVEGRTGNDINLYALYVTKSPSQNISIPNARSFQYTLTYFDESAFIVTSRNVVLADSLYLELPVDLPDIKKETPVSVVAEPLDE